MSVTTASGDPLDVLGGVFVAITLGTGIYKKTSIQMAYISESVNQVFLSEDALNDLDILPPMWPKQETRGVCAMDVASSKNGEIIRSCSCPDRTEAPLPPTELPMFATEGNIPALRQWIVDRYRSSAFNICTHQPLPLVNSSPAPGYMWI